MIPFLRKWLAVPVCLTAAFLAGFVAFHPGWKKTAPLTDGSAASFAQAAEKIEDGHLLQNATPQERVAWLLEICRQPGGLARDHALYEAIQQMQPGDFLASVADLPALARELTAMDENVRSGLLEAGVVRWLEVDRTAALRWLALGREIAESGVIALPAMGSQDLGAVYGVLAAREPEWLREQIGTLGKKTQRATAIRILMSADVQRDPRKARAWLETFRGSKDWDEIFPDYVNALAAADPRAAMDMALSPDGTTDAMRRSSLAMRVVFSPGANTPALKAELLDKIEPKLRHDLTWAAAFAIDDDGGDAYAWLTERLASDPGLLDLGARPEEMADSMMRSLRRDSLRTLDFIATLPEAQQPVLREAALATWSQFHPDTFLDWLATQPPEALPKDIKGIERTAGKEPERFARWIATLPAGELRERSQLTLAGELAKQGRVADALRQFPQSSTVDSFVQAARAMGGSVGAREPAAAAQWVRTLPAGPAQAGAAQGLVGAWATQAPQAAAHWIESLPVGGTRDAATGTFAGLVAGADPAAAEAWLAQIGDSAERQNAARQVFRAWARTDADGARKWLRDFPDVSDAMKARLLRSSR